MKSSVNTIIRNSEGKYLMQMRDGTDGICNPLKWNFFGGGISEDEDPITAAAREIKEELNIKAESSDFELPGKFKPRDDRLVYVVSYKPRLEWGDFTVQEGAGAGYFTKEELLRIDLTDATRMLAAKFL